MRAENQNQLTQGTRLELATRKLFEGMEVECYVDVSTENGDFYMTAKQIGEALEYKDRASYYRVISRNADIIKNPISCKIKCNDNKKYNVNLYSIEQVLKIVSFVNTMKANALIEELSKLKGYTPIKTTSRYEIDFENILLKTFKDIINIEKQYCIDRYRVDWYIPGYNVIIECDENGHDVYNKHSDELRTNIINMKLYNPKWIRFNPNDKNFNLGSILNEILLIILGEQLKNGVVLANNNINNQTFTKEDIKSINEYLDYLGWEIETSEDNCAEL